MGCSFAQVLCLDENELTDRGVLGFLAPALQVAGGTSRMEQLGVRQNRRITSLGRAGLQRAATHFNGLRATTNNISSDSRSDGPSRMSFSSSPSNPLSISFDIT